MTGAEAGASKKSNGQKAKPSRFLGRGLCLSISVMVAGDELQQILLVFGQRVVG